MRTVSATWRAQIPFTHTVVTRVDSYRAGKLLAADIPIVSGLMRYDDTGDLKRRLTITVPAFDGTTRWDPGNDVLSPLNAYGQRLRVSTGIAYPGGTPELVDLGETLITSWKRDEPNGVVVVEAIDLAQFLVDAGTFFPMAPRRDNTFWQEFVRVAQRAPNVLVAAAPDAGLVDRPIHDPLFGSTLVYGKSLVQALSDLCDAWRARWYTADDGLLHAGPAYAEVPTSAVASLTLTDGATGTITARGRQSERGAIANAVVVTGKAQKNGGMPLGHATIDNVNSPIYVNGPYGRVTRTFQSDLIDTIDECNTVAEFLLGRYSSVGRAEKLSCVPDASVQMGDIGRAYTEDGDAWVGRIATIDLPLTPSDGAMVVGLSNQPGVNI